MLETSWIQHNIHELGMKKKDLEKLLQWSAHAEGMVLCVGPTGCGKTTTCYSLLNEMKEKRNILTLEDPVEFAVDGLSQIALDQESPNQPASFAEGLHDLLRHDPDTLFLGEIRDDETARAAVQASFNGHVLLSTMHSRDPVGSITLLRSMGIKNHEIAASLKIIVGQRLLRRLCKECRRQRKTQAHEDQALAELQMTVDEVFEAPGCDACGGTGHQGLRAIFEIWRLEEDEQSAILKGDDKDRLRSRLRKRGVGSLVAAALGKAATGEVAFTEALSLR